MIKTVAAIVLALGIVGSLAGCGNTAESQEDTSYTERQNAKYEFCVSHGGSWSAGAWGSEKCDMSKADR
jgi:hypothetical protein